jgi:hypothetical protein
MSGPGIGRREFLEGLAATAVAGLAAAGGVTLPACAREDPLERALRGFFADAEAARAVGGEVLALDPDAGQPEILLERLARRRAEELRELARSDPEGLAERLRAQHRADLAEDRVVVVRGWLLSETEAWLLALAALP